MATFNHKSTVSRLQSFKKVDSLPGEEYNSNGKRTLPFNGADQQEKDSNDQSEMVPYTNKKLKSLIDDRGKSDK